MSSDRAEEAGSLRSIRGSEAEEKLRGVQDTSLRGPQARKEERQKA